MIKRCTSLILAVLACSVTCSAAGPAVVGNLKNPPPFRSFAAPPSGVLRFLVSDQGKVFLKKARTPAAIAILKGLGEDLSQQPVAAPLPDEAPVPAQDLSLAPLASTAPRLSGPQLVAAPQTPIVGGCGIDGTVFNMEPAAGAEPQIDESVGLFL